MELQWQMPWWSLSLLGCLSGWALWSWWYTCRNAGDAGTGHRAWRIGRYVLAFNVLAYLLYGVSAAVWGPTARSVSEWYVGGVATGILVMATGVAILSGGHLGARLLMCWLDGSDRRRDDLIRAVQKMDESGLRGMLWSVLICLAVGFYVGAHMVIGTRIFAL